MRMVSQRLGTVARGIISTRTQPALATGAVNKIRLMSSEVQETDEEFDARYVAYFSRPDIDGWEIRKAMNQLVVMDLVPEPKIIIAALHACRRVNDYALTTRWLEAIRYRSTSANKEIYPYILKEIRPTLDELGISTPEDLGYDKPELALESVFDMHGPSK